MATAKEIVKKAESQKGNKGTKYIKEYGASKGTAWCVIFLWWVFKQCKASKLFCDGGKTAYIPAVDEWGKEKKLIVNKNHGKLGDIVVFDWGNDGTRDHVGLIVKKNKDGSYETIEGNTSGGIVANKTRYKSDICHIIRPKYAELKPEKFNLTRKLKKGMKGNDVKELQKELNEKEKTTPKLKVDGDFGKKTEYKLSLYQKFKGWNPSKKCGKKTAHSFGWLYKGK